MLLYWLQYLWWILYSCDMEDIIDGDLAQKNSAKKMIVPSTQVPCSFFFFIILVIYIIIFIDSIFEIQR